MRQKVQNSYRNELTVQSVALMVRAQLHRVATGFEDFAIKTTA
jgi:hypothetical protein